MPFAAGGVMPQNHDPNKDFMENYTQKELHQALHNTMVANAKCVKLFHDLYPGLTGMLRITAQCKLLEQQMAKVRLHETSSFSSSS